MLPGGLASIFIEAYPTDMFTTNRLLIYGEFFSMSKLDMNNSLQIIIRKCTQ